MISTSMIIAPFYCHTPVSDPSMSVRIMASPTQIPVVGSMYSLSCTVSGAGMLTGATITYQWFKDGVVMSGQTMETLSFTSLSYSDAGGYTCQATVMSSLLSGPINSSNSIGVYLTCKSLECS